MKTLREERRKSPRLPFQGQVNVTVIASSIERAIAPGQSFRCQTGDVSRSGLKIICNRRLKSGAKLELWVVPPHQLETLIVCGTVRWSQPLDGNHFSAGIELSEIYSKDMSAWHNLVTRLSEQVPVGAPA